MYKRQLEDNDFAINAHYKTTFDMTNSKQESYYFDRYFAEVDKSSFVASGHWQLIPGGDRNCWLLSAPNSALILSENQDPNLFTPTEGWQGEYLVREDVNNNDKCGVIPLN